MDLNRTAKESTEAVSSFMRRRNCAGVGGCRGGGGTSVWCWGAGDSRGDGCGECKVDVDKDVDMEGCGSASVVRMVWWWML
jgi:hypothetical protein